MPTNDGHLLPWERGERPEGTGPGPSRLQERISGQQVSRLYYLDQLGPTGSPGMALEFTSGAKLIIFAGRDRGSGYSARLFFRYLKRPLIVLPRMEKAFGYGRTRGLDEPADELQKAVEGEVVIGAPTCVEKTAQGGEMMTIEFKHGNKLVLWAEPTMKRTPAGAMIADVGYAWAGPERSHILLG